MVTALSLFLFHGFYFGWSKIPKQEWVAWTPRTVKVKQLYLWLNPDAQRMAAVGTFLDGGAHTD